MIKKEKALKDEKSIAQDKLDAIEKAVEAIDDARNKDSARKYIKEIIPLCEDLRENHPDTYGVIDNISRDILGYFCDDTGKASVCSGM